MGRTDFQPNIRKEKTTNLSVDPFQAWVFISNRSDTWQQQQQQQQHLPLTAQSFPGGKSSLSGQSEPAVSFNRISQQKVRSTMSKLCTIGSGAGFDVSQSSGHILWRFCLLPPSSLWELIKHWTAWGQASAQSEKDFVLSSRHLDRMSHELFVVMKWKRIVVDLWWSATNSFYGFKCILVMLSVRTKVSYISTSLPLTHQLLSSLTLQITMHLLSH